MNFLDRHLPILTWVPKAIKSRAMSKYPFPKIAQTREAFKRAEQLQLPILEDAASSSNISAVQFQLGCHRNLHFTPMDQDIDNLPLAENEVLFVPISLFVNRYITYYSSIYYLSDIEGFVDPKGVQNTQSFKTIPCWGRCTVYRSNNPNIKPGSTYYGFWPISAYGVRKITNADSQGLAGYHDLPHYTGPKEWLKIIRVEDDKASYAIDNCGYTKIGMTYAREIRDMEYFGAERLIISSASSTSGQLIAMCLKELNPEFQIVGLTSERNAEFVKQFPYFDEVYTYDEVKSSPNANQSLYFDALGRDSVSNDVFDHFKISRWWIYGEGGEKTFMKYMKKNPRGTFYTNLTDSHLYQIRNGITDTEILDLLRHLIKKYDLETLWYKGARAISSSQEVFDLYQGYINNSHTGEKVVYRSPLPTQKIKSSIDAGEA